MIQSSLFTLLSICAQIKKKIKDFHRCNIVDIKQLQLKSVTDPPEQTVRMKLLMMKESCQQASCFKRELPFRVFYL